MLHIHGVSEGFTRVLVRSGSEVLCRSLLKMLDISLVGQDGHANVENCICNRLWRYIVEVV